MSDMNRTNPSPSLPTVQRAVVQNQMLWTAGYSLTSGSFLTYFAKELGASWTLISLILVIPETIGVLAIWSSRLVPITGSRKKLWWQASVVSRMIALGIPLCAIDGLREQLPSPVVWLTVCLAISQLFQAIAYLAYLSWLSDLVPETNWGRFLARRNIAKLIILLFVPLAGAYLRDQWRTDLSGEQNYVAYLIVFLVGNGLILLSLWPMMKLPAVEPTETRSQSAVFVHLKLAWKNPAFRYLCLYSWSLAVANGMTQSAFFHYRYEVLHLSLVNGFLLLYTMNLIKIPLSEMAGRWIDQYGARRLLWGSLMIAAFGTPIWVMSSEETWGILFLAHALWGLYAVANIAQWQLAWKHSPSSENQTELGLFRQIGGLFAGVSGFAGGLWLSRVAEVGQSVTSAATLIILVSFALRILAPQWLLLMKEAEK
jgi:Na+/melibiose symporter-like transporter